MGATLVKGGNVSLSRQAPGVTGILVGIGWQVAGTTGAEYDLDASALLCDRSGKVLSEQHFVFFNNLSSPDGSVRHSGSGLSGGAGDKEQIQVDLAAVPAGVEKIVFPVAIYEARARGQNFGQVRGAYIRLADRDGGAELVRYDLGQDASTEAAMVFGELYRNGSDWKFRAVGQGYASGLAGIARDFGVTVLQEAEPAEGSGPAPAQVPVPAAQVPAQSAQPVRESVQPAPTTAGAPVVVPGSTLAPQQIPGSSSVTCFFDPGHGAGLAPVLWSPQWGVPRQIQACAACAQRVQTTPPPFYTPQAGYPQAGYPQPVQQGYPQQVQPGVGQPDQQRRYGTGALIGAGAAGLIGGALIAEALDDDEPEVIVNNYYEGDGDFF
ncbi:hypothetical protein GCM10010430_63610 [Kitasatospora cystarginea]|uniref:TerD domain-containing protein n=1 Tax=Kitasatospora cystarginea TaxID=58350 RepID=A0ABN3ESM2_9ACTN